MIYETRPNDDAKGGDRKTTNNEDEDEHVEVVWVVSVLNQNFLFSTAGEMVRYCEFVDLPKKAKKLS